MDFAAGDSSGQLGLLDLAVDLSVPEVYSGTEFTLYLHVKNPFARPVWISSVELSLPTQLSAAESAKAPRKATEDHPDDKFLRNLIREREPEIKSLNRSLRDSRLDDEAREKLAVRLRELEEQTRADYARLTGGLVVETLGDSTVNMTRTRASHYFFRTADESNINVTDLRGPREAERVPLLSSLPPGAALQPGSTDVWTIRLGSRRTPFFIPARYKLQLTVIYALVPPPREADEDEDPVDLYSNTTAFTTQVRAALWSVIVGGVLGGVIGSVARSLQGTGGTTAFGGAHANSTIGALSLSAILSGAAVVFSARKSDAQSFVTVEDFWGGLLVGFLIGYSGTAAFTKITGSGS